MTLVPGVIVPGVAAEAFHVVRSITIPSGSEISRAPGETIGRR